MSLRRFCDRCSSEVKARAKVTTIHIKNGDEVGFKPVDLCPSCSSGLNYWLHKPAPWMRDRPKKYRKSLSLKAKAS